MRNLHNIAVAVGTLALRHGTLSVGLETGVILEQRSRVFRQLDSHQRPRGVSGWLAGIGKPALSLVTCGLRSGYRRDPVPDCAAAHESSGGDSPQSSMPKRTCKTIPAKFSCAPHVTRRSPPSRVCGSQCRGRLPTAHIDTATSTVINIFGRAGSPDLRSALLFTRGGGGGVSGWFGSDTYDEFPEDFDYDDSEDYDGSSAGDVDVYWPEMGDELDTNGGEAVPEKGHSRAAASGTAATGSAKELDGARSARARWSPTGFSLWGGSRKSRGSSAPALSVSPAAPGLPSSPDSLALRNAPKLVLDTDFPTEKPGILLGFIALGGAFVGLLGVKIREALAHRRGAGGDRGQGEEAGWGQDREGQAESGVVATEPVAAALASEEGLREQQAKIEELENQLAYLEEDRRRVAAAAKEARASRRKDDRELKEYVQTLEVHLDQLSREKQEVEASMVESVREETAKAFKEAQERDKAAAEAAAHEVHQLRADLEATRTLMETALREKETVLQEKEAILQEKETILREKEAAEEEKVVADALLRKEEGRGGRNFLWRNAFGLRGGGRRHCDEASHDGKTLSIFRKGDRAFREGDRAAAGDKRVTNPAPRGSCREGRASERRRGGGGGAGERRCGGGGGASGSGATRGGGYMPTGNGERSCRGKGTPAEPDGSATKRHARRPETTASGGESPASCPGQRRR